MSSLRTSVSIVSSVIFDKKQIKNRISAWQLSMAQEAGLAQVPHRKRKKCLMHFCHFCILEMNGEKRKGKEGNCSAGVHLSSMWNLIACSTHRIYGVYLPSWDTGVDVNKKRDPR